MTRGKQWQAPTMEIIDKILENSAPTPAFKLYDQVLTRAKDIKTIQRSITKRAFVKLLVKHYQPAGEGKDRSGHKVTLWTVKS